MTWPAWKERLEKCTAHLAVQAADTVYSAATADREVGHVELFIGIGGIFAPKRQNISQTNLYLFCVIFQVFRDQVWREAIKAGGYGRVGSKEIARARCRERILARALRYAEKHGNTVDARRLRAAVG